MKSLLTIWAPFQAGAEIAAERLAVGLQESACNVVAALGRRADTWDRMRQSNVRCIYVPMAMTNKWRFWRYLRGRRAMERLLRSERPDLVHANDLPTSQMVGEAARRLGIPRICHHRFPFPAEGIAWLNKFGAERHLFVSHSLMDEMIAVSPELRDSPRAVVYDGLPLPPAPCEESRLRARCEFRLPADKIIVTFAGQVIERKGVADLLRAWTELSSGARQKAVLLIIGDDMITDGAYREAMERLAGELDVPARFVGFQRNVDRWWLASDVGVIPSTAEPLGLVTLEAMAAELPVVGCAVGGIRETIVDGETGLLVPPRTPGQLAAALERLINDAELRRRFGAAGRKRCEAKFSLKAHVEAVLEQYRIVLEAGGTPHSTPFAEPQGVPPDRNGKSSR